MAFEAYLAADRALALARKAELPASAQGAALFADISGFTPLTDALVRDLGPRGGAEELARHLNAVYESLIGIIQHHGGVVVSFSGDAVTCWFTPSLAIELHGASLTSLLLEAGRTAVRCAFALQGAMAALAPIRTPGGATFTLAIKVAVAVGAARRLLVGDPAIQRIDVLAGATLLRLAAAEHGAERGEVVTDAPTAALLADAVRIVAWRHDEHGTPCTAVLAPPAADSTPVTQAERADTALFAAHIRLEQARPLLPLALAERLAHGYGEPPTELRPALALFGCFATLDYDNDPAAGAQLDAYVRWVQAVVAQYGGTLLDVAIGDKGSTLYAAFGAPVAHENDPERALRAALDLQAPPPALAWANAPQIGIARGTMRTGAYGSSGRRTYGVLGDAVNVAARLMQAAAGGQILASAAVQQACADLFSWEALPPLPLKGKRAPLAAFRLVASRAERGAAFYQNTLVGRDTEIERLLAAAQPVLSGQFAGVCYVAGEAGIGKSRFVYEARRLLGERTPLTWLYCPSDDVLRGSLRPFATFLQAFFQQSIEHDAAHNKAQFADVLDGLHAALTSAAAGDERADVLAAELDRTRSFLGALVGLRWDGSLYEQLEPKLRFENTLGALATLIKAVSLRQPVWLELEDAHWLDDDSRALVTQLSRTLAGYPVVIVCAARPDDEGRPFALPLADDALAHTIDLAALSPDGTHALTAQALGGAVGAALARFVYERTGGNPFFAEQLLLDLRERGIVDQRPADPEQQLVDADRTQTLEWSFVAGRSSSVDVPDTLNRLLVARLDRLHEPVRAVVQTAAVLGREWALPVLAAMRSGDDGLPPLVRAAEDGRVWSPLGERDYLFRHVLLRDAAYDMQAREQLRALHQRAATAIEQEYAENLAPQYAALAYHSREAEDHARERRYARLAGEAAAARYANAEAITFFSRALELTPEDDLEGRWEGRWERSKVYNHQGNRVAQLADIQALEPLAEALDNDARRAEVALRRMYYAFTIGEFTQATEAAQQAFRWADATGADDTAVLALEYWAWSLIRRGELAAVQSLADLCLARSQTLKNRQFETRALNILSTLAWYHGDLQKARNLEEHCVQIAREIGDIWSTGIYLGNLGETLSALGDYTTTHAVYEEALSIFQSIGNRRFEGDALQKLGTLASHQGDYQRAELYLRQGIDLSRSVGDRRLETLLLSNLSMVASNQGNFEAGYTHSQEALRIAGLLKNLETIHAAQLNLGRALMGVARLNEAIEAFRTVLATANAKEQLSSTVAAREGLARAALAVGNLGEAQEQAEVLLLLPEDQISLIDEPMRVHLTCYQVLNATNDPRAPAVLEDAYQRLKVRAAKLPDEAARRMFLENVPHHRELVAAWEAAQQE